jgi:hypothetical protein
VTVMGRGPADEAVVVVKRTAKDGPGDRTGGQNSSKVSRVWDGGEGRNMLFSSGSFKVTVAMRSAIGAYRETESVCSANRMCAGSKKWQCKGK